jgi:ribosome-associated heat shock protein Hsp15
LARNPTCNLKPVSALPGDPDDGGSRLDKWLWAVRVFKTRPLATAACRAGDVEIGGLTAKPARAVHAGETVAVKLGVMTRTLQVVAVPRSRIGAKLVSEFAKELTPAIEFARSREHNLQRVLVREKGAGRPTKRERRTIDRLFG